MLKVAGLLGIFFRKINNPVLFQKIDKVTSKVLTIDTNTMESIRKEWDRIEALASAPGPDSYKHKPSQVGSGL